MIVFQRLVAEEAKVLAQVIDELLSHLHFQDGTILDRNLPHFNDLCVSHGQIVQREDAVFSASWA
jgi:hypothetical protein